MGQYDDPVTNTASSPTWTLPDVPPLRAHDAQLWLVPLDDPAGSANLSGLLSQDERARADRFRKHEDRERYIALHAATRLLLGRHRDVAPERICIASDAAGKPAIDDGGGPCFSISRSDGIGLIGIASMAIGVDVETIRDVDEIEIVARRYFTPGEATRIARLRGTERRDAFFACWTRKEAVVKAVGAGLSIPLSAFEPGFGSDRPTLISIADDRATGAEWTLWSERDGNIRAACAVRDSAPRFSLGRFGR